MTTTVATIVGMAPQIFEMAIGLERMIVAGIGLLLGTVLTMVVIPVVYASLDSLATAAGRAWNWFWMRETITAATLTQAGEIS